METLWQKIIQTHSAIRFFIVGSIGFLIDASILYIGLHFGVDPLVARIPSFLVAVMVTWALNRDFTFNAAHKSFMESFPLYISSNAVGIILNFAIYSGLILFVALFKEHPVLALPIGSFCAMFFNYASAKYIIFRKKP